MTTKPKIPLEPWQVRAIDAALQHGHVAVVRSFDEWLFHATIRRRNADRAAAAKIRKAERDAIKTAS